MDINSLILDLYSKGHSIGYITQCVYKDLNKPYFRDFYNKKIADSSKYHKMEFCRNLVESTILEHITTQRT